MLCSIVEGEWKDSKECTISLEEWDEQTVEYLLQWLYFGHYTLCIPYEPTCVTSKRKATSTPSETNGEGSAGEQGPTAEQEFSEDEDFGDLPEHRRPLTPMRSIHCLGPHEGTVSSVQNLQKQGANHTAMFHFSTGNSLLPDAQVYTLAQYLQLDDLKRLAFYRIQDELVQYKLHIHGVLFLTKFVDLARYVYASTDWLAAYEEPMRKLVSTFVAVWFKHLNMPEFEELLSNGGDFVVDIARKIGRGIWNEEL